MNQLWLSICLQRPHDFDGLQFTKRWRQPDDNLRIYLKFRPLRRVTYEWDSFPLLRGARDLALTQQPM